MLPLLALRLLLSTQPVPVGHLCTPADTYYQDSDRGYPRCRRHVTNQTRRVVLLAQGIAWAARSQYEVDHYIPLCAGGSNETINLWAQAWPQAKRKDVLENRLCRLLRQGRMTQGAALAEMRAWR